MTLNSQEVDYLSRLLDRLIGGSAVQKIHQPREHVFVIEAYGGASGRVRLHIDLSNGNPLLYLATKKLKNPQSPTALCAFLRNHLTNSRIRDISAIPDDRVCFIHFEKMTEAGLKQKTLAIELIPGYPVLFLLDDQKKILAATQSIRNQNRTLARNDTYVEPPHRVASEGSQTLFSRFEGWTDETLFEALEELTVPVVEQVDKSALAKEVARALKRQRKKISKIEVDLRRLEEQEVGGDQGELLKSALNQIEPGMTEIAVRDWAQEGEVFVTIPLDPSVSPQENLERLFRQSKKSARGQETAKQRLEEQRLALRQMCNLEERLADKKSDLDELAAAAIKLGLKIEKTAGQPVKKKVEQPRRKPYKTYQSKDGIPLLVGRTSRDNDEVTFKHCKGNEWWFHADGYAGSHVVAKTSGELPQETLLDAATLAIEFSKAASGGKQAVSYTQRKNVSKYKGANPGQVILRTHKTIMIRFESDRLARLQKAQND